MSRILLDTDWKEGTWEAVDRSPKEIYIKIRYEGLTKKEVLWRAELLRREASKRANVTSAIVALPVPLPEDSVE